MIHRFSWPAWLRALKAHIALMQKHKPDLIDHRNRNLTSGKESTRKLFDKIIGLDTREAFMFAPCVTVAMGNSGCSSTNGSTRSYAKVKIRSRLSDDGGGSVLAD
ncbi:hypothetical protein M3J07_003793 [Ascochyta lentis]